jgi:CHAT domain-containing protein
LLHGNPSGQPRNFLSLNTEMRFRILACLLAVCFAISNIALASSGVASALGTADFSGEQLLSLKKKQRAAEKFYEQGDYGQAFRLAKEGYEAVDDLIGVNSEIGEAFLIKYVQSLIQLKNYDEATNLIMQHMKETTFRKLISDPISIPGYLLSGLFSLGITPAILAWRASLSDDQGVAFSTANLSTLMLANGHTESALQMARMSYLASEKLGRSYFGSDARFVAIAQSAYYEALQKSNDAELVDFVKAEAGRSMTDSVWHPDYPFLLDLMKLGSKHGSLSALSEFVAKYRSELDDDAFYAYSLAYYLQSDFPDESRKYLALAHKLISDRDNDYMRSRALTLAGIPGDVLFYGKSAPKRIADLQMRAKIEHLMCHADYRTRDYSRAKKSCSSALEASSSLHKELSDYQNPYVQSKAASLGGYDANDVADSSLRLAASRYYLGEEQAAYLALLNDYVSKQEDRRKQLEAPASAGRGNSSGRMWPYKELIKIHARAGKFEEALFVSELTKARSVLEFATKRNAVNSQILPDTERMALEALELQMVRANQLLADPELQASQRISLESKRDQLARESEAFRNRLYEKHPKFESLSRPKVLSFSDARKFLPADAAFVSYVLEGDSIWAFTVVDGQLSVTDIGAHPELGKEIDAFQKALSDQTVSLDPAAQEQANGGGRNSPEKLARRLGDLLLGKLPQGIFSKQRLFVSPEGILSFLPFETLIHRGEFLLEGRDVGYVHSLSMLSVLAEREKQYRENDVRTEMLVVANPVYQEAGARGEAASSKIIGDTPEKVASRGNLKRAFQLKGTEWSSLPGTEQELKQLLALYPDAKALKREQASETELKKLNASKELSSFRILHFATHGYVDAENPNMSSVVLSQVGLSPEDDGYVSAAELPGYDLRSNLVVLSACETGLGKIVEGEGVMGLPFALFVAGNTSTVVTLWQVADDSTSKLMSRFYELVKSGKSHSSALSAVKREFAGGEDAALKAPFYWAPFVYYGL